MRSPTRSSSWITRSTRDQRPQVDGHRLLAGQQQVGAVLDRVGEIVEVAVVGDHLLDRGEVGVEERAVAASIASDAMAPSRIDVGVDLVQLLVELLSGLGHGSARFAALEAVAQAPDGRDAGGVAPGRPRCARAAA